MKMKLKYFFPLLLLLGLFSCQKTETEQKFENKKGNRIVETGELAAIDSRSFVMQRYGRNWYQMKIIGLLKHGSEVKAGDSIIQLDATEIKKYIIERESDLETQIAALEKLKVDQSNQRSELESNLKSETASQNLRKLELESSRFESERIRKIKQLEFEQSNINFKKVQRKISLNKIKERCDLQIQKIKINRLDITFYRILLSELQLMEFFRLPTTIERTKCSR